VVSFLFKVLQEKGVKVATPLEALRAQLDDPMYDEIPCAEIAPWRNWRLCRKLDGRLKINQKREKQKEEQK
jgi:hypothetical protein